MCGTGTIEGAGLVEQLAWRPPVLEPGLLEFENTAGTDNAS
ncbi:hypothetical protein DsansV1_C28g0205271 [Dioscorea sansibarensis]